MEKLCHGTDNIKRDSNLSDEAYHASVFRKSVKLGDNNEHEVLFMPLVGLKCPIILLTNTLIVERIPSKHEALTQCCCFRVQVQYTLYKRGLEICFETNLRQI